MIVINKCRVDQGGKRYFMTFIDDPTTLCCVLVKIKKVSYCFKIYKDKVENQLKKKIKRL